MLCGIMYSRSTAIYCRGVAGGGGVGGDKVNVPIQCVVFVSTEKMTHQIAPFSQKKTSDFLSWERQ